MKQLSQYVIYLLLVGVTLLLIGCKKQSVINTMDFTMMPTALPQPVINIVTIPTPITPSPTPTPVNYLSAPCPFDISEQVRDVSCGVLIVPENRQDKTNSNKVGLPIAIFSSPSNKPQPDPIVYLSGGPGSNTLEIADYAFESQFGLLLADRDLILVDQRGMGFADPSLACSEFDELMWAEAEIVMESDVARTAILEAMTTCHRRLTAKGIDLAAYNSAESAADIADLRIALGYDQWNLLGVSYGTRLAQTIMRDHPSGIRSVVLDSVQPIATNLLATAETNADRAFDQLYQQCALDPECNGRFEEGLEDHLASLVARLNQTPLLVSVLSNNDLLEIPLTGDRLVSLIYNGLYSAELIRYLPRLINEVGIGETELAGLLLRSELVSHQFVSVGAHFSIQCREEHPFVDKDDVNHIEDAIFSNMFKTSLTLGTVAFDICALWDIAPASINENEPITSTIPTLILTGAFDPITPPEWGEEVAADLPNSQLFKFDDAGHGLTTTGCGRTLLFAFLDNPFDEINDRCINRNTLSFQFPALPANTTIDMVTTRLYDVNLQTKLPFGWTETLPGVFSRQQSLSDQTVLMQQTTAGNDTAAFLETLVGSLNIQLGDPMSTLNTPQATWTQYQAPFRDAFVDVAITTKDNHTIGIVLISDRRERNMLYRQVMRPILEVVRRPIDS